MHFVITPLALLFSVGITFSQAEKIHFRTLALAESEFPELWVYDSAKPAAISFPASQPSSPVKADRPGPLRIFKRPLDDQGKPEDAAPALVNLPTSSSILLLGWMTGEKPGFLAIEDPFLTMKNDDWLFINTTGVPLAIQIGETAKPVPIKANSHQNLKITAPSGTGAAVIIATQQADGTWKSVYSSYWPIYDDKRGLVVAAQKGERFNFTYINDQISNNPKSQPPGGNKD